MTRHHIRPRPGEASKKPKAGLGFWVVLFTLALPLAAILVMTGLGGGALNKLDRDALQRQAESRAGSVAWQVNTELNSRLDELSAAAAQGRAGDAVFYDIADLPADADHLQALRQAKGAGKTLLVLGSGKEARIILAAVDNEYSPQQTALVEITVRDFMDALPCRDDLQGVILLDRFMQPLGEDQPPWPLSSEHSAREGEEGLFRYMQPVQGFPLHVGVVVRMPGAWSVLLDQGLPVVVGALVCIVVTCGLILYMAARVKRRFAETDRKRELAFREMEHVQKLSSIGRLAAGVAHEINNPLAIIAEKAGLMKDLASAAKDMPKADRFISLGDSMLQAVTRCRAVTHRLLGFARRMEVRSVELNLNEVLREVLGFLEREALFRDVTLDLELSDDLPMIESDRGQLQQVFLNILNNAMSAVEDKGCIRVASKAEQNGVAVEIEDDGMGMSRETLEHIFEPFFTTKGEKGTGLGLSITYGIVNKLGGTMEVASEQGRGSTFTIHLPLKSGLSEGDLVG